MGITQYREQSGKALFTDKINEETDCPFHSWQLCSIKAYYTVASNVSETVSSVDLKPFSGNVHIVAIMLISELGVVSKM